MSAIALDTHEIFKTLEAADFSEKQAEAITLALCKQHEVIAVVTKQDFEGYKSDAQHLFEKREERVGLGFELLRKDIQMLNEKVDNLGVDLRKDIQSSEQRTSAQMSEVKHDILKWMVGLGLAFAGFLVGLIKLLPMM